MANIFTYRGTFKIARMDGTDIRDVTTSNTVRAADEIEVEFICHSNFMDKALPTFPGYKVLQLPTVTNGKLGIRVASDAAWN